MIRLLYTMEQNPQYPLRRILLIWISQRERYPDHSGNLIFFYHPVTSLLTAPTAPFCFHCAVSYSQAQQFLVGQALLNMKVSRSESDTPHSAGLLWKSDQPNTQHSQKTDTHAPWRDSKPQPTRQRPQTHALDGKATGISPACGYE